MIVARRVFIGVLLASALFAACGGDDPEDFAAEVEQICVAEADAFEGLSQASPETDREVARQIEQATSIREQALADLQELEPPEEVTRPFDDFIANREESLAVMRAASQAAARGDRETLDVATTRLSDLTSDRELIAAQLGADACVGGDSED